MAYHKYKNHATQPEKNMRDNHRPYPDRIRDRNINTYSTTNIPDFIPLLCMTFQTGLLCFKWSYVLKIQVTINCFERILLRRSLFKMFKRLPFPIIGNIDWIDRI